MMQKSTIAVLLGGIGFVFGTAALVVSLTRDTETRTVVRGALTSQAKSSGDAPTVREVYEKDAPGVVFISSEVVRRSQSPFGPPQEQKGQASGSGFVLDKKGFILTNAHVVDGASNVEATFEDDKTVDAKIVGTDLSSDVALLKVDSEEAELKPLELGSSDNVHVGDPVVAIGNPFGLDRTVTTGIVSAIQRQLQAPNNFTIRNVIQTDAAINPGNSGGPLLDVNGKVIGINSQIATAGGSGGSVGIGFAIPIDQVEKIAKDLRGDGKVEHAFLGITGASISSSIAKRLNLAVDKGVLVQTVTGPAKKAGVKGGDTQVSINGSDLVLGGDVITKIDDKTIESMDDVIEIVDSKEPGNKVTLTVRRSGKTETIDIKLGDRPARAGQDPQDDQGGQRQQPQVPGLP